MFKSLKTVLAATIGQPQCWKRKLLAEWPTIVGTLHSRMNLEKVYDDTLIIGVYDSSWLNELYLLSHVLIKTINQALEKPYIKKVRFKHVVPLPSSAGKKIPEKKEAPTRVKITLNSYEAQALLKIKDEEMRTALHLFLSRCKEK